MNGMNDAAQSLRDMNPQKARLGALIPAMQGQQGALRGGLESMAQSPDGMVALIELLVQKGMPPEQILQFLASQGAGQEEMSQVPRPGGDMPWDNPRTPNATRPPGPPAGK